MYPRAVNVTPLNGHLIEVVFSNNERKHFDLSPYLGHGLFSELKDPQVFNSAKAELGTVTWANGLDICPDTLYIEGVPVN